ncbi:MAG TPA: hypothetical protein VEW28_04825 [Candidatus Kapabacteria bacterium]|nr:hypothetical protein [Candidatus Kapabacteria bacterium]
MTPFKYIIIFTICIILCKTSYAQSDAIKFEVIEKIAQTEYHPTFSAVTAKLLEGINPKLAYGQLDTLLGREYGDMFWMYGCAGLYFSCKNILPVSYKQKIRECWKHFTPYRGDTENHFLMYYGSLFLFSEEWDSLDASEWFMGRSSQEINAESKEWLLYWIHETVRTGMTEFDSPRYLYYYITPLVLLSEYSRDSAIRSKSEMMLEYLLANYSVKYLGGSYCGAHSRDANESTLVPSNTEAASYGEYFFEDSITHILPDIVFVAATSYVLPEIIREIAHKRNNSFECTEIVRSRRRVRYEIPAVKSIHKYTYMARDYALGSLESGIAQPIQQRTWSLVLRSQNPYSVIAGLHPYYSAKELGTFFPEEPSFMLEKIEAVKAGYTSEDKWVGASPYETVWQRRNELRCSYDIP